MLGQLIGILTGLTYGVYVFAIFFGIMILASVGFSIGQLSDKQQGMVAQEVTPINLIVRSLFGLALLTMNSMALYALATLGAADKYLVDPHAVLGYVNGGIPSKEEEILALFVVTMSRCIGAFALFQGLKHGQYSAHPQEHIRQSARMRATWGIACGVVFIFPGFWADIATYYFSSFTEIATLIKKY